MRVATGASIVAVLLGAGCGPGDNSSVRSFHPTVKSGMPLVQLVAEGEKAQKYDIRYRVMGRDCSGDRVEVGRKSCGPYIRVIHPPPSPQRPGEEGYHEVGYATREEFARGLAETLPRFYACKAFVITFGRYQGWPRADSFRVKVDTQGQITSVSELEEDKID